MPIANGTTSHRGRCVTVAEDRPTAAERKQFGKLDQGRAADIPVVPVKGLADDFRTPFQLQQLREAHPCE